MSEMPGASLPFCFTAGPVYLRASHERCRQGMVMLRRIQEQSTACYAYCRTCSFQEGKEEAPKPSSKNVKVDKVRGRHPASMLPSYSCGRSFEPLFGASANTSPAAKRRPLPAPWTCLLQFPEWTAHVRSFDGFPTRRK